MAQTERDSRIRFNAPEFVHDMRDGDHGFVMEAAASDDGTIYVDRDSMLYCGEDDTPRKCLLVRMHDGQLLVKPVGGFTFQRVRSRLLFGIGVMMGYSVKATLDNAK